MTTLVITVVGDDRAGLVSAVADIVDTHGGNWENSELAELAGAFAGIVQVSVPTARADGLRDALQSLAGTLTVTVHAGPGDRTAASPAPARSVTFDVVGNDRPGIVREVSAALTARGASIERLSTQTTDAAMSGGRLFAAAITATLAEGSSVDDLVADVERLAGEIQVDVTVAG